MWTVLAICMTGTLSAGPINPMVFKKKFEDGRRTADVVAQVRVLAAVCSARKENSRDITLELALQVLMADKGSIKKGQVLTVSRQVTLPAGPGPKSYGYMAQVRQFPFTPGVKGEVALRWEAESRSYRPIAGWVAEPNGAPVPAEVGKAYVAGDRAD